MEKSARCGFLHTRLSPSRCQPTALGSADLACPIRCCRRTAARAHCTGQTAPIGKSPALALECRGFFCSALIGGMPERHFLFPHQLLQKVENSHCMGFCRAQAVCSPTRLFPERRRKEVQHQANCPHRKLPGTRTGMPGSFLFRSDGRHAGGVLSLSASAAAKGGKLSLYGLLPGAGSLLTSPLTPGALPQGGAPHRANRPIRKSPALALECRGFFIHL